MSSVTSLQQQQQQAEQARQQDEQQPQSRNSNLPTTTSNTIVTNAAPPAYGVSSSAGQQQQQQLQQSASFGTPGIQHGTLATTNVGNYIVQSSSVSHQQHQPTYYTQGSVQGYRTASHSVPLATTSYNHQISTTTMQQPQHVHHSVYRSGGQQQIENTYYGSSRFVTGEERVVGFNTIQQEERVISERTVVHEVKVPKKVIREEVIEKVIIVPETITREEVIEEIQTVRETIVEVAKPIIQEKIVEVPEIEYRDKIIEVVEKVVQEKIKEVPGRVEYQERVVEVPKYITEEKVVEVPEIEYREIITEKVVEVPEYREQYVVKEVPAATQYVDKPYPEYVTVEETLDVERNLPVPVEVITSFEYKLAQFRPRVHKVSYPLYVPRFVEVPVAAELFSQATVAQLRNSAGRLTALNSHQAIGLCDVEQMATEFRQMDLRTMQVAPDVQQALRAAWDAGTLAH